MLDLKWAAVTPALAAEVYRLKDQEEVTFLDVIAVNVVLELQSTSRHTIVGLLDRKAVAELDFEILGEDLWLSIWVAKSSRGQGLGRAALEYTKVWAKQRGLSRLVGGVSPTNAPSLRLLRSAGFSVSHEPDADGLLRAELRMADQFLQQQT